MAQSKKTKTPKAKKKAAKKISEEELKDAVAKAKEDDKPVSPLYGDVTSFKAELGKLGLSTLSDQVQKITTDDLFAAVPAISTGNIHLDFLFGGEFTPQGLNRCRGVPMHGLLQVWAEQHGGKTSFALHCAANTMKNGMMAMFMDFERSLDLHYAYRLGVVNPDLFVYHKPESLQEAISMMLVGMSLGVKLIVIDSIGASMTHEQREVSIDSLQQGETKGVSMGGPERLWSLWLPRIKQFAEAYGCAVIGISQLRANIVSGFRANRAPKDKVQGGRAWPFFADFRLSFRQSSSYKIEATRVNRSVNKKQKTLVARRITANMSKAKKSDMSYKGVELVLMSNHGFSPRYAAYETLAGYNSPLVEKQYRLKIPSTGDTICGAGEAAFLENLNNYPGDISDELYYAAREYLVNPDLHLNYKAYEREIGDNDDLRRALQESLVEAGLA